MDVLVNTKIVGPGKWKRTNLNQCHRLLAKITYTKDTYDYSLFRTNTAFSLPS